MNADANTGIESETVPKLPGVLLSVQPPRHVVCDFSPPHLMRITLYRTQGGLVSRHSSHCSPHYRRLRKLSLKPFPLNATDFHDHLYSTPAALATNLKFTPWTNNKDPSASSLPSAGAKMSGADPSSSIDLTLSDEEDNYGAASDMENQSDLVVSLKRRLWDSSMEDWIDQDQLQACIEEDVLHHTRIRPTWGFGRIFKPHTFPRQKSMTPSSSQEYRTLSTQQPCQASLDNEFALGDRQARTGAKMQSLGFSRTSSLARANTDDLQMLDAEPSDFFQRSAKMLRYISSPKMSPGNGTSLASGASTSGNEWSGINIDALYPLGQSDSNHGQVTIPLGAQVIDLDEETGNAIQNDHRLDRFENDYLADAEYEAFLRSERRKLVLDGDIAESIEVDDEDSSDTELVANLKRINLQNRAKSTASASIVPMTQIQHQNHTYKAGKCAELYDGSFLRINSIHKDVKGDTWLVGDLLLRTNFQGPRMPKRRNELVWVVVTNDITNASNSSTARNLTDATRIRNIRFTNQRYEKLNTRTHENALKDMYDDVKFGELFCRIRRIQIKSASGRKVIEESIELIAESEAEARNGNRIDASNLRDEWRGIKTVLGGSSSQTYQSIALEDVGIGYQTVKTQKYSYGDAFCGAGGTSRGAAMAGLKVKWGFDFDRNAIVTYRANFGASGTQCCEETVADFLDRISRLPIHQRKDFMVDVLHISPPCQPFSPAHTVPNEENDAKNRAALCSVLHLIQVLKPRVVTIEETEGLLSRHDEWFSTLIHIFVYVGYSVRWKALRCENYGVPQERRRLFICASAPGEKLPNIAKPTHGAGDAKLVTIHDAISEIPRAATNQELPPTGGMWPKRAFSANTLSKTLTCNGGPANYYPSGERNYTLRELASLQTFPWFHLFPVTGVTMGRKQIGNAVPPLLAKTMYEEIIRTLEETDGVRGRKY